MADNNIWYAVEVHTTLEAKASFESPPSMGLNELDNARCQKDIEVLLS